MDVPSHLQYSPTQRLEGELQVWTDGSSSLTPDICRKPTVEEVEGGRDVSWRDGRQEDRKGPGSVKHWLGSPLFVDG